MPLDCNARLRSLLYDYQTSAPVRGLCVCADPPGQRTGQTPSGEVLARRGHRMGVVDRLNRLLLRGRELRIERLPEILIEIPREGRRLVLRAPLGRELPPP